MNCTNLRAKFLYCEASPYIAALSGWLAILIVIFTLLADGNITDGITTSLFPVIGGFIFEYCYWMFLTIVYLTDKYCFKLFLV